MAETIKGYSSHDHEDDVRTMLHGNGSGYVEAEA